MDTLGAFVDVLSNDDNYHYVSILIDKDQSDKLEVLLESMDFNIEPNRNYDKTNIEVITDLNSELESIEKEMKETEQFFIDSSKDLGALKLLHDQLLSKESKLQIDLLSTETTVYVEGWVRSDQVDGISEILNRKNLVFELEARDALPEESVPTALKNNRFVKPYEYITNQFSTPSASEVDPNPSMSLNINTLLSPITSSNFIVFLALAIASSMVPTSKNASSGKSSCLPSKISLKPRMVSSNWNKTTSLTCKSFSHMHVLT